MNTTRLVLSMIVIVFTVGTAYAGTSVWSIRSDNVVPDTNAYALWVDGQGDDWTQAFLRMELTTGGTYQDPFESLDGLAPSPAFFGAFPALEFDTYVGNLADGTAGIVAVPTGLSVSTLSPGDDLISATWFNNDTSDTGPFQIGNITLSDDATGTWELVVTFANSEVRSSGTIADLPEPASLSLMALGGLAALRRR